MQKYQKMKAKIKINNNKYNNKSKKVLNGQINSVLLLWDRKELEKVILYKM